MSRTHTLYLGEPEDVANVLADNQVTTEDLRLALLNIARRFAGVYRELAELRAELQQQEDER